MVSEVYFSVVIPTYNRAIYVKDTIHSVLCQDFQDFEIIIIDDGSTDPTEDVIREFKSEKIVYVKQSNKERGAARNHGIKLSKGKFVIILDSDDILYYNHLSTLKNAIQKYPANNFFAAKFEFFDKHKKFASDIKKFKEGLYDYKIFLKGNPLAANICFRKDNPLMIFYEEDRSLSTMEDWVFLLQNLKREQLYLVDIVTVGMREHELRSMNSSYDIINKKRLIAAEFVIDNLSLNKSDIAQIRAYSYYFCAVNCYIQNQRSEGLTFVFKHLYLIGFNSGILLLLAKILIGKKLTEKIKNVF
jgi:glycosyltransferase involved in cell wall biosynthesis